MDVGEGLAVAAAGEKVLEVGIKCIGVLGVPEGDGLGDFLKLGELGPGIAVAEIVVRDDVNAPLEEEAEVFCLSGGHGIGWSGIGVGSN